MTTKKNNNLSGLSEKEEKILRMKDGIVLETDAILPRKTKDPILLAQLLELERAIMARHKP